MTSNSIYSQYVSHWFSDVYNLSFVLQDGSTFNIPYEEQKNGILVDRIFATKHIREVQKKKIFPKGKEREELTSLVQDATEYKTN